MTDRPRSAPRPLLWAALLAVAAGTSLCAVQAYAVQPAEAAKPAKGAQGSKAYNSNAPVNYSADRIEVQDKDNRVVLTGNVDVIQDTMHLTAARVTVNYTNNGSLKIQQMIATGNVYVTRGTDNARGDVAVYDLVNRIITMTGNVTIIRNGDPVHGGRAVMNLATGKSSIDARPAGTAPGPGTNGRVSGTFTVQNNNTTSTGTNNTDSKKK